MPFVSQLEERISEVGSDVMIVSADLGILKAELNLMTVSIMTELSTLIAPRINFDAVSNMQLQVALMCLAYSSSQNKIIAGIKIVNISQGFDNNGQ